MLMRVVLPVLLQLVVAESVKLDEFRLVPVELTKMALVIGWMVQELM